LLESLERLATEGEPRVLNPEQQSLPLAYGAVREGFTPGCCDGRQIEAARKDVEMVVVERERRREVVEMGTRWSIASRSEV
jgi:hypothetical protein